MAKQASYGYSEQAFIKNSVDRYVPWQVPCAASTGYGNYSQHVKTSAMTKTSLGNLVRLFNFRNIKETPSGNGRGILDDKGRRCVCITLNHVYPIMSCSFCGITIASLYKLNIRAYTTLQSDDKFVFNLRQCTIMLRLVHSRMTGVHSWMLQRGREEREKVDKTPIKRPQCIYENR